MTTAQRSVKQEWMQPWRAWEKWVVIGGVIVLVALRVITGS